MREKGRRNDVTEVRERSPETSCNRAKKTKSDPRARLPRPKPSPTHSSKPQPTTLSHPSCLSPNQKAQLRPNPLATTREQKLSRPETRKPKPTPDAHSPAHLQAFPFNPGPVHHSRSTQTRDCNRKPAHSTRQPAPRPETAAHTSPSGCAMWHVCSVTPLGFGGLIGLEAASRPR